MDPDRFQRVKEIFQGALELDGERRAAYLSEACGEDDELRAEVEKLLVADGDSEGFLDTPHTTGLPPGWSESSLVGTSIGTYELTRAISSGGMGTVYEAIQEQPRRTVAIKVMKQGVVSKSVLRRFEYEAEIMAGLNHPHIAQVIEAGTFETGSAEGLPYLVMEFVPGALSITDYARRKNLATKERLGLFLQVCEAVHYGHGKGVIHRDLKPGNILVDGGGGVKVIDFGVARVTNSDLALTTVQTEVGQLLGTLQYMSPEQCEADPDKLDIRSDVYALGVVLYEVLCEALPYDVRQAAVFEAARLIREEPPKQPSTADRTLRGDVETILLKALEKERRRRYQTVSDFETDIRRYLGGEVILARRAGLGRRLAKFIRRNLVLSSAVGVSLLCLVGFLVYVTFWSYPRLQEEKAKLEVEVGNTQLVNDFLREMLSWADPFKEGREVPVAEMLDRAAERIDTEFPDRPGIEASLRHTLGVTYLSNGRFDESLEQLERSLELRRGLHPGDTEEILLIEVDLAALHVERGTYDEGETLLLDYLERAPRTLGPEHPEIFSAMTYLGELYMDQGRYEEAEEILDRSIARSSAVLGEDHENAIAAQGTLAMLYVNMSRFTEAKEALERNVEAWRRTKGPEHPYTLAARTNLASMYHLQDLFPQAIPIYEKVLETSRRTLGPEHPYSLKMLCALADCHSSMGRYEEAEAAFKEALGGMRRVLGPEHPSTLSRIHLFAEFLGHRGRFEEAEPLFLETLETHRRLFGDDDPVTINLVTDLALMYYNLERTSEAAPLLVEAFERKRRVLDEDNNELLTAMNNLAGIYWREKRYEEAEPLFLQAYEGKKRILGEESMSTIATLNNLASLYMMQERFPEAEVRFKEALELLRRVFGEEHPNTLTTVGNLGVLYRKMGRLEEAEQWTLDSLEGLTEALGEDFYLTLDTRGGLGMIYTEQGRYEEAEAVLSETLAKKRELLGDDAPKTINTLHRLVELYERQERWEEAEPLARELIEKTAEDHVKYDERQALLERVLKRGGD